MTKLATALLLMLVASACAGRNAVWQPRDVDRVATNGYAYRELRPGYFIVWTNDVSANDETTFQFVTEELCQTPCAIEYKGVIRVLEQYQIELEIQNGNAR